MHELNLVSPSELISTKSKKAKVAKKVKVEREVRSFLEKAVQINDKWFIPGRGPRDAKVMVIAAAPSKDDLVFKKMGGGVQGSWKELSAALTEAGFNIETDIYYTSVIKKGLGSKPKPSSEDIDESWGYLDAEIAEIKPKLIIALGAEVFKRVMCKAMKVTDSMSEIIECPPYNTHVLANHSPGAVLMVDPTLRSEFKENFVTAYRFANDQLTYRDFTYEVVTDVDRSKEIVADYIARGLLNIGYDAEWLGTHWFDNEVMYTFQFSCEEDHAVILDISKDGKTENWDLLDTLKPLLEHPKAKRMGWNIRADDTRLIQRGFELPDETLFFDGMKAVAFFDSRWGKGLETGIRYFTSYRPYYNKFNQKLREHGIKKENLSSLKFIDPEAFYTYCAGDAVSHKTACESMHKHFPAKLYPLYQNTYLPLTNYFLDMEMTGIPIDKEVLSDITEKYSTKYKELQGVLTEKVKAIGMEDFNPNSAPQKKELLFTKLNMTPAYYTKAGKSPKPRNWYEKQTPQVKALYSPSTNGKSLATMNFELQGLSKEAGGQDETVNQKLDIIQTLLSLNRVGVFATKFLSRRGLAIDIPEPDEEEEELDDGSPDGVELDPEGKPLKQSYWAAMCSDNRIRASFYECLDNFRASSKPNVQNPASKVLAHIPEIFVPGLKLLPKDEQKAKEKEFVPRNLRHIFYGGGKDWLWAEADVGGADLGIMAFLSRDPDFINDIRKGNFHVTQMRKYFQDETLTKDEKSKYVIAKGITFRISYTSGLHSAALPIQADIYAENGISVDLPMIQYALKTWENYQVYMAFRDRCTNEVINNNCITSSRGLKLTFDTTDNFSIKASWQNEALAFPVASELAWFMWDISVQTRAQLKKEKLWQKYVFPVNSVHDAGYWVVHRDLLKDNWFPEFIKYYMTKKVKISTGDNLGMELTIADRWKGKEVVFENETKWNYSKKVWDWKH